MRFLKRIRVPAAFTVHAWLKAKGYQINSDYSLMDSYFRKGRHAELWSLSLLQKNNEMVSYPILLVHPYIYVLEWRPNDHERINMETVIMTIRRHYHREGMI